MRLCKCKRYHFFFSPRCGHFYGDSKKPDAHPIRLSVRDHPDEDHVAHGYGDGWKMAGRDGLGRSDVTILGLRMEASRHVHGPEQFRFQR